MPIHCRSACLPLHADNVTPSSAVTRSGIQPVMAKLQRIVIFTRHEDLVLKTHTIKEFIKKNSKQKIIIGERLTPEGKTLYTAEDVKRSDRVRYVFEDRTSMTLTQDEINNSADFNPKWAIRE